MRCLLCTLALVLLAGCRTQSTAMTNPFLAPNRVPPPATRTLLPGTAQPYYPGDPVPNSQAIGAPPVGYAPGSQQTIPTYAPPPAGIAPPGGWNGAPQPLPGGSSAYNVLPGNLQPESPVVPLSAQTPIEVPSDQQSLRFAQSAPPYQQPVVPTAPVSASTLPLDPSVLPERVSPYPNRLASYEVPYAQQQLIQQSVAILQPREVRIRAISSDHLTLTNSTSNDRQSASSDGFRPQGSSQVRKPTLASRLVPRKREPVRETSDRFGFDPQFGWLRGQLLVSSVTGQWALRYAPTEQIAGQPMDRLDGRFGGSLTIANPHVLGDLQPGDFVQLRGRVEQSPPSGMPVYNVSVVQRQLI